MIEMQSQLGFPTAQSLAMGKYSVSYIQLCFSHRELPAECNPAHLIYVQVQTCPQQPGKKPHRPHTL